MSRRDDDRIFGLSPLVFVGVAGNVLLAALLWTVLVASYRYDPHSITAAAERARMESAPERYGCVIDAGSTGTRLHVYKFRRQNDSSYTLADELFTEVDIGLSSLATRLERLPSVVQPLIDAAIAYVPASERAHTKLTLRATAGLRLLPPSQSNAILHGVRELVRGSPFRYGSVSVISGTEEGVWGWLTVNYLLHRLDHPATTTADAATSGTTHPASVVQRRPTVAIMDLGGASTQFVFEPIRGAARTEWVKAAHSDAERERRKALFHHLRFAGTEYILFEKSYLRYGLMEARRRSKGFAIHDSNNRTKAAAEAAAAAAGDAPPLTPGDAASSGVRTAHHPCLPESYLENSPPYHFRSQVRGDGGDRHNYTIRGSLDASSSGNASCPHLVRRLFAKDHRTCARAHNRPHCSFDGIFQPKLHAEARWLNPTQPIYAFSYFHDRTAPINLVRTNDAAPVAAAESAAVDSSLDDLITVHELGVAAHELCRDDHTEHGRHVLATALHNNPFFCFDLTYVAELLHTGYELPADRAITIAKKINGVETGWCLGSALMDMFGE